MFSRINDFAGELLNGRRSGKYSPVETAQWLEDYADAADKQLAKAKADAKNKQQQEFRRMALDVSIQIGLGRFFGSQFRSGVLYGIYEQSGDRQALEESLKMYRKARGYWSALAGMAKDAYKPDITVGEHKHLRGHWLDRLPAMDMDIAYMAKKLEQVPVKEGAGADLVKAAIVAALGRSKRSSAVVHFN